MPIKLYADRNIFQTEIASIISQTVNVLEDTKIKTKYKAHGSGSVSWKSTGSEVGTYTTQEGHSITTDSLYTQNPRKLSVFVTWNKVPLLILYLVP